jgi:PAS domain S-box-containing protein
MVSLRCRRWWLGYVVYRHRQKPGGRPLLGAIVGAGWWCTSLLLATVIVDYTVSMWLQRTVYLGVVAVVAGIFLFGLEYTGREYLMTRETLAVLSVHPISVAVMISLNPGNFFFETLAPAPGTATGVAITFGPAFWVHTAYSYLLVSVAALLVIGLLYRAPALDAAQYVIVFGAIAAPTVANFAYIAGPIDFDAAPLGFVASAGLFTIAITQYQFIDLVPIARDRALEDINDAVFIIDADGHLVDVNTAGRELADEVLADGGSATDIVGREFDAVLEEVPEARRLYRRLRNAETEQEVDLTIDESHFRVTATPMVGDRDHPVGWLFVVRDVTERERRERQLRERNEQLDQFASVVSHDLRNPLTVARGYTDLAQETGDLSHLEETDAAHERMETIIDDVLSLARGGDDVTDLSPTGLRTAAEEAWRNVEADGCSLKVADDVRILADRTRLIRLFENLFRNAVEHGPTSPRSQTRDDAAEHGTGTGSDADEGSASLSGDGGAVLTVTVGATADGFYVADDGVGIPHPRREQIFEEGHSTSNTGTGTGLTIVQRIAATHGWCVECSDASNGGARFDISDVERVEN